MRKGHEFFETLKYLSSQSQNCSNWICKFKNLVKINQWQIKNRFTSHFYTFYTILEENLNYEEAIVLFTLL